MTAPAAREWTGASTTAGSWLRSGAWAILDQALFALANFSINVIFARWLSPQEYGVFTLGYAIFLVLGTAHTALLTEPMVVYGVGKHGEKLPLYLTLLMKGHWLFTAGAGVVLTIIGVAVLALGHRTAGAALLALAVANPFILMLWLMRRCCYVRMQPHVAASGGALYMVVLLAGTVALFTTGWLSSPTAFVLMGGASLAAGAYIRSRLKLGIGSTAMVSPEFRSGVLADHWNYGRWAVGTGVLGAILLQAYYVVMPARHGLESTAVLRALTNLIMPALQTTQAVSAVALPQLVSVRHTPAFARVVRNLLALYVGGAIVYWLLLGLLHGPAVALLYGGRYMQDSYLLWIVGLLPVAYAGISVLETTLRSIERSDQVFHAYVLGSVVTCAIGIPLSLAWGPAGAMIGLVASSTVTSAAMFWSLRFGADHLRPAGSSA